MLGKVKLTKILSYDIFMKDGLFVFWCSITKRGCLEMKKIICYVVGLIMVICNVLPVVTVDANSRAAIYQLPLKDRVSFTLYYDDLESVGDMLLAEKRATIEAMMESGIAYTESEAEKAYAQSAMSYNFIADLFACVPFVGGVISSIFKTGANVYGELKKSDIDKTQEMLQQMMERIDTRFDIVERKLDYTLGSFNATNQITNINSFYS